MNRTIQPQLKTIEQIKIIEAEKMLLDNGIPLYQIHAGTQELIKIEIIFPAGDLHQPIGVIASATAHLIDDGTSKYTSAQIAERFDFYGASIETGNDYHECTITLYVLNKYLEPCLQLLAEIITEAAYPVTEIESFVQRQKQNLIVNNEKVDYVARKQFKQALFGNHPYGATPELADFDALTRSDILKLHSSNYQWQSATIVAAGFITPSIIQTINKYLGAFTSNTTPIVQPDAAFKTIAIPKPQQQYFKKENAIQAAIRIGCLMVNRNHTDFKTLMVLNTAFGGYFGSRLMRNIREDKGYTYGINASLVSNLNAGNLVIATEVGQEVLADALEQIYFEMDRITNEPLPDMELDLVKQYMQGAFLRSLDGPFALAQRFRTLLSNNLSYAYYYQYLEVLQNVTPGQLLAMAQKYFNKQNMVQVVAGG
ncbi:MAG: insulinase family protein [Bacteroidia bacterium]|nr:insulinase family protein [Bacteroidia bacterium]